MDLLILVVASLFATHRLTVLVIEDKITEKIRERIFNKWNPGSTWSYVLTCPWCVSIWIGAIAAAGIYFFPTVWLFVALMLSFSSITGLIESKR